MAEPNSTSYGPASSPPGANELLPRGRFLLLHQLLGRATKAGQVHTSVLRQFTAEGGRNPFTAEGGASGGAVPDLPLKASDHLMDATRYALHTHLSRTRAADA